MSVPLRGEVETCPGAQSHGGGGGGGGGGHKDPTSMISTEALLKS